MVVHAGFSARVDRAHLRSRGIRHTIPESRDQQADRRRRGGEGGRPTGYGERTTVHLGTIAVTALFIRLRT
ncbi:hypothetical protein [Actinocorallia aurantiaca]|uniref:Uncharacterized protein n=1 Tax=Actinocorallia aurantiaca TaxID=46204 RepID=A0ABP6H6W4_9ACTN